MSNTCNKTSNNKYFDCPARMDDGRIFTDYRPSSSVDDMIRYSNNVMSSYEYRQFLINNATNIMDVNMNYTVDKVGCNSCDAPIMPFHTECNINDHYSKCDTIDSNGIGIYNKIQNNYVKEEFRGGSGSSSKGGSSSRGGSSSSKGGSNSGTSSGTNSGTSSGNGNIQRMIKSKILNMNK